MREITITEHQPSGVVINPNLLETFRIFWDNGYDAWTVGGKKRRVEATEIEEIVRTGVNTLNIYSFLFREKESAVS